MQKFSDLAFSLRGQRMFQILATAKEMEKRGRDIIHLEIGDPDFDTPKHIVDAACAELQAGNTHYVTSNGLEEFREAAAETTLRSRGFKPSINQILVTPGGNVQIYYAIACTVNPGEEVIIADPSFVSYSSIISLLGAREVAIPLHEKNEFRLDPDDLEQYITDKTRMIIINSPHNPTGSVMTEDEMERIYRIAEKNDIYLLSDEVYGRMIYEDAATKFATPGKYDNCEERTIIVHSFSKSYAMTGWRIGAVTAPAELVEKMALLLETTTSCVSPFLQKAALQAMTSGQEAAAIMVEEFRRRRDIIVSGLNALPGVSCIEPKGAFYAFPNVRNTRYTSEEFSQKMLEQAGVATCPGNYFGVSGEGYVRLCYANSVSKIEEALRRMELVLL